MRCKYDLHNISFKELHIEIFHAFLTSVWAHFLFNFRCIMNPCSAILQGNDYSTSLPTLLLHNVSAINVFSLHVFLVYVWMVVMPLHKGLVFLDVVTPGAGVDAKNPFKIA